jgi:hypothetical protein
MRELGSVPAGPLGREAPLLVYVRSDGHSAKLWRLHNRSNRRDPRACLWRSPDRIIGYWSSSASKFVCRERDKPWGGPSARPIAGDKAAAVCLEGAHHSMGTRDQF